MNALVLQADGILAYSRVPDPTRPGERFVRVRVAWSGICNSDLARAFGGGAYHYPLIMGHEFSALVEESFAGGRFAPGDRVVVFPLLPCRRCVPCQTGDYAQCVDYDYFGSRRDGGFAERLWVPEENLFPVPAGVSLRDAALTEPAAVALHGVRKLRTVPGDSAAVFGGGAIGNLVAQWLQLRGCRPVFVVDLDPDKLAAAAAMGFTPVDPRGVDPVAFIAERTGGGARCVVEAVGLPLTFRQALLAAGRFAEVVLMGNIRGALSLEEKDVSGILRRELVIHGTWNSKVAPRGQDDWSAVLDFMAGGLQVAPLISHTPDLAEGAEVFRRLSERSFGPYGRIVFRVAGDA